MNEKDVSGAGYIYNLYVLIEQYNSLVANYRSTELEILSTYTKDEDGKVTFNPAMLTDTEKQSVLESLRSIRVCVINIDIKLKSLSEFAKVKFSPNYDNAVKEISGKMFPSYVQIFNYSVEVNRMFVSSVMSEFLQKANDLLKVYRSNPNE